MKGLVLNNFYSTIGNIKLFLSMVIVFAGFVLATGNATALELFVYITISAFSINAVVSSRKDAISKWNKYEITLPIQRKEIIQSKYLSYMLWVTLGTVITLAVTFITMLIHRNSQILNGMDIFYSVFALGIGISLLTGAIFYPMSYIVGIDKSETILIISVLLSLGLVVGTLMLLNIFIYSFHIRMLIFIAFYFLIFALSYALTICLFKKKQF